MQIQFQVIVYEKKLIAGNWHSRVACFGACGSLIWVNTTTINLIKKGKITGDKLRAAACFDCRCDRIRIGGGTPYPYTPASERNYHGW